MTESRATRLRSARKFGNREISTRRIAHKRPFWTVLGFFLTEINFTTTTTTTTTATTGGVNPP